MLVILSVLVQHIRISVLSIVLWCDVITRDLKVTIDKKIVTVVLYMIYVILFLFHYQSNYNQLKKLCSLIPTMS